LKFRRTLGIAAAAGGPLASTGLPRHDAHQEFHRSSEEFAEVGAEIVGALEYSQVPDREKDELVAAYMTSMDEVVQPAR
jgi:hemoglobin